MVAATVWMQVGVGSIPAGEHFPQTFLKFFAARIGLAWAACVHLGLASCWAVSAESSPGEFTPFFFSV